MRRTKAKDKLADMIEEAIDNRIDAITEYCEKNKLSYSVDIKIWKWGEKWGETTDRRKGEERG